MEETIKTPTIQELVAELKQWCAAKGVVIGVVALGARTGAVVPIDDFMPPTHNAGWALQFVQPEK